MSFPCTKCGLCCQNISKIPQLESFHTGDGVCRFYKHNEGCVIYTDRPLVCKIDEGFVYIKTHFKNKEAYYKANAEICNELQQKAEISEIFRVKL